MLEKPGNGKLAKHMECIKSVLTLRSASNIRQHVLIEMGMQKQNSETIYKQ